MAINTVTDFANWEKGLSDKALKALNDAVPGLQKSVSDAVTQRALAASRVETLKKTDDALRAKLAAIATPGDAVQILKDLSANTILMRGAQKAYVIAVQQLDLAQRALAVAQAQAARATAAGAQANTQVAWATKDDADNTGWEQAANVAPLTTIPTDSGTILADANGVYKKANARLGTDVPAKLLGRALDRGRAAQAQVATAISRQQAVEDLADSTVKTQTQSDLATRLRAYRRAQNALRDYVTNGAADSKRALDVLASIPTAPPLTADEIASVNDNALVTAGGAAIDLEAALATAADALDKSNWTLELGTLTFLAATPDGDPKQDATVKADMADVVAKQAAVTAAQTAYTATIQNDLAKWELALPDATWRLIASFLDAEAILNRLVKSEPSGQTGLRKTLTDAEAAYAAALETDAQNRRANQVLQDAISNQTDLAAATASAAPAAELSAVRGDS